MDEFRWIVDGHVCAYQEDPIIYFRLEQGLVDSPERFRRVYARSDKRPDELYTISMYSDGPIDSRSAGELIQKAWVWFLHGLIAIERGYEEPAGCCFCERLFARTNELVPGKKKTAFLVERCHGGSVKRPNRKKCCLECHIDRRERPLIDWLSDIERRLDDISVLLDQRVRYSTQIKNIKRWMAFVDERGSEMLWKRKP